METRVERLAIHITGAAGDIVTLAFDL